MHEESSETPAPSIRELRTLVAFVESDGVTAAARNADVDPSTLSRQLAVFKSAGPAGTSLLTRSRNQLVLTDKGEAALPAVRDVVNQYEQLLRFLRDEAGTPQVVRLGLGEFAHRHYLPSALAALRSQRRRFRLLPEICRGRDRILRTARGKLDLAIVTHDPLQIDTMLKVHLGRSERLVVEPVARQRFCLIAKGNSPAGRALGHLRRIQIKSFARLAEQKFVGLDPDSGIRRLFERILRRENLSIAFEPGTGTGGWPAAKEFARRGVGIAFLPLAELEPIDRDGLIVRRLPEAFSVEDSLIHRPTELNSAAAAAKEALIRSAKSHARRVQKTARGR